MNRITYFLAVILITAFAFIGCSGSGGPAAPDLANSRTTNGSGPILWGYYDLYLDIENMTMEAIPNRDVMWTVNIVNILNKRPAALGFSFNGTEMGDGYLDVSMDLSITHPFGGNPGLNGYDVRGILCTNGTETLETNTDLVYPSLAGSQLILNADGYTRWFNPVEFTHPGLYGFTPGIAQSGKFEGTSTLNPYKYFASGMLADDDAFDFLIANADSSGTFASGATVTRTYELRFGLPQPGIQYGYAIMANWNGTAPANHPANSSETVAFKVEVTPSLWYTDESNNGGDLILDISTFGWADQPEQIYIESTVLSSAYTLTSGEMTPTDSGDNWATYHVEIPADNVTGVDDQEFWVICQHTTLDYQLPAPNTAGTDNVMACYRQGLFINNEQYNQPPEIIGGIAGEPNPTVEATETYSINVSDPNDDPLTFEWTVTISGTSTVVFTDPGDGAGSIEIDWPNDIGVEVDDVFDLDVTVSDGIAPPVSAPTLQITIVPVPNYPPEIISGVDGEMLPTADSTEDYTVDASDPEDDPLTYTWTVRDLEAGPVYNGPGTSPGLFTINWTNDFGAQAGDGFIVFCIVSDTADNETPAEPLIVSIVE